MFNNSKKTSSRSSKELLRDKSNNKRLLGKATSHNDQNMLNMDGQRPKIGGN